MGKRMRRKRKRGKKFFQPRQGRSEREERFLRVNLTGGASSEYVTVGGGVSTCKGVTDLKGGNENRPIQSTESRPGDETKVGEPLRGGGRGSVEKGRQPDALIHIHLYVLIRGESGQIGGRRQSKHLRREESKKKGECQRNDEVCVGTGKEEEL